ncbi:MAG: MFS transporter [Candidatus Limnocylindria bacterium]
MTRSINAVLLGNFTLRFSTGLTGALLLFYLTDLPRFGGVAVSAFTAGVLGALYFAAELILSPFFGVLADRFGTHRLMQPGPIMGGVAVVATALTTSVPLLAGTRFLEGAAAAASVPAALGYIAIATSSSQALRGRIVARFEVATLGGVGIGSAAAGFLYSAIGPSAFYVNAVIYGITLLILRYGVDELPDHAAATITPGEESVPASLFHLGRYRDVLRSRPVWLLAPTWIALNALLGSWGTQALFQLVQEPSDRFADQVLMRGFEPWQAGLVLGIGLLVLFSGLLYWGNRFVNLRRTTIIGIGLAGGGVFVTAILAINHSAGLPVWLIAGLLLVSAVGLFVLAGATPAAVGFLSDVSEGFPGRRGVIMGLYSVFLALGQIIGAVVAGVAAEWRGIDGLLIASGGLLIVAIIPLGQLRAAEHHMPVHPDAVAARAGKSQPLS